jgi:ABC-2 type transport system permease protein
MKNAFSMYRHLAGIQIRSQIEYRASFLFDLAASIFYFSFWFLSLALIFQKFENLGGWSLPEVAFLYGMVEMAFGIMDLIFSGFDPQTFGQQVRLGSFDQILLRPINLTLQIFGSQFILRRLGRITQGIVIFGLSLSWLDIEWTIAKMIYLPFILLSLVCFFGGLYVIGATITFWTIESIEVVNIFTYGGSEMMSYPMHIYQRWMRQFFTYIIPAIFLNYYPALYILDKPDPFNLPSFAAFLAPVVGIGIMILAFQFWKIGVRHYQSTGT